MNAKLLQLCLTLRPYGPHQALLQTRMLEWVAMPCPSPGDCPDPGIEPGSPALQAEKKPINFLYISKFLLNI